MLQIYGPQNTPEYAAAQELAQRITRGWADIQTNDQHQMVIIAAAKCYGQQICDIDLVLFFHTTMPYRLPQETPTTQPVDLVSFCVIIEVKDHPPELVRFVGPIVEVSYHNRWHNVSEQNYRQCFSVKGYLEAQNIKPPFIVNFIWLRNVPDRELPPNPHNILGKQASWETILQLFRQHMKPYWHRASNSWRIQSTGDITQAIQAFSQIRKPQSTKIEEEKIKGVIRSVALKGSVPSYVEKLGSQLLIFQGRGGTGKTATLLKLAHVLYTYRQARVLILTYNRVLTADIRRLLALMDVNDRIAQQSISVQTVHSFFYQLMKAFGILPQPCNDFIDRYDEYKMSLEMLLSAHTENITDLIQENNNVFSWEFVFIDEAQDWPVDERNILYTVYDYHHFVIADGGDQLTRGYKQCDWTEHVITSERQIVTLSKGLRLKPQVCDFVNAFAEQVELKDWKIEPFGKERTGRVIIFQGHYTESADFHTSLTRSHTEQGRSLIDMLFCVPPRLVRHEKNGPTQSVVARVLDNWGYQTWDATNSNITNQYAITQDQIRIVQYDSCRGLEGWTVVHLEFDEFYTYKVNTFEPTETEQQDMMFDREQAAHRYALRWLMIPLTRGIHTLVIHLTPMVKNDHPILIALRALYHANPGLILWHKDDSSYLL